jgi:hypothetical protein
MKLVSLILMVLLVATSAHAEVLSFKAWKTARIEEAKSTLTQTLKGDASTQAQVNTVSSSAKAHPNERLSQAQMNVEIAQELTIQDYFIIYLSQFKSQTAFQEAAKKLSAEEMGELLVAYKKQLSVVEHSPAPRL